MVVHRKCCYQIYKTFYQVLLSLFYESSHYEFIIQKNILNLELFSGLQGGNDSVGNGRTIDLSGSLNAEAIDKISIDSKKTANLAAYLPAIQTSKSPKQQIKDTIASPQFQQALSSFSAALQSGQLGPVVSQFELSSEAEASANTGDLERFVKALERKRDTKSTEKKEKSNENDHKKSMEEDKNA